jgi:hypothetical protein
MTKNWSLQNLDIMITSIEERYTLPFFKYKDSIISFGNVLFQGESTLKCYNLDV